MRRTQAGARNATEPPGGTTMIDASDEARPGLAFTGRWQPYLGLAIGNLVLTIVTIGIYRFWAKTRVRRHLWERTLFQGEPLEYFGRGVEKMVGAALVFVVLIVPLVIVSAIAAWLRSTGSIAGPFLIYVALYVGLLYLFGVGLYRAQRYLFSRTAWRGIRGGMRHGGWHYGARYLRLVLLQFITFGFASPFVATRLWNARMDDAMFGSVPVSATAEWRPIYGRFLAAWIGSLVVYIVAAAAIFALFGSELAAFRPGASPPADPKALLGVFVRVYAIFFLAGFVIALLMLRYYAALLRQLFGATRVGGLGFAFDAGAPQLLRFTLGNLALIALTLGVGVIMMPYRIWSFYVRHLATTGYLDPDSLGQTELAAPVQGDGLADAFDAAAF